MIVGYLWYILDAGVVCSAWGGACDGVCIQYRELQTSTIRGRRPDGTRILRFPTTRSTGVRRLY